jgi:cytochrome c551/c552
MTKKPVCMEDAMRITAIYLTLAIAAFAAPKAAGAEEPRALLQHYKCYVCHSDTESRTGPAYTDVAAKYRGRARAVPEVAAVIRKGARSGGPWHMPPHPEVSDAEAKAMARYILSLP